MLDDATVEMLRGLAQQNVDVIENGMVVDVDDPIIDMLLRALANRAQYLNEVGLEFLISRLKQLYVERLPDKGLSSNDFTDELLQKVLDAATKGDLQNVKNELLNMINNITGFDYLVVSELPSKGKKGVLYLLRLTSFSTVKNLYEEYIWVNDRYELLGSVEVGGELDGPFVTTDDLKDKLKDFIKKIKIGDNQIGPDINGIADISDAIMSLIKGQIGTIGSVNHITVNGVTYDPTNGTITLPTLAHQVKVNGSTYTADAAGLVTLQNLVHRVKVNGSWKTVGTTGDVDLGSFLTSGDIPSGGLTIVTISLNGGTYSTDANGTITLPTLAHQVKINGSTKTASASGLVDLGTIESGGHTTYTGTTDPASTLGKDNDFYYKFPS